MVIKDEKRDSNPEKGYFIRTLVVFGNCAHFLRRIRAENYTNSTKKLLPLTDLTIIIKVLGIRINSYQS